MTSWIYEWLILRLIILASLLLIARSIYGYQDQGNKAMQFLHFVHPLSGTYLLLLFIELMPQDISLFLFLYSITVD